MNERIRQLAEQAREYARNYVTVCRIYGYYMEHNEEQVQFENEFSELIVRECAKWMSDGNIPDGSYEAGRMLQHFGVEE
jgi:hypothetical protein